MCEIAHDWGATKKVFPLEWHYEFQGSSDYFVIDLIINQKNVGSKPIHLGIDL